VQPKHIVNINRYLTSLQRQRIEATPFKWMLHLEQELDISIPLLRELISRWSVDDNCFRIRQHLVPFKVVDVCFALGLRVVGEELCLQVNKVFGGDDIKIDILLEKLGNKVYRKKNVDEICRLYILLLLYVFFLLRTSRTFSSFPFKVLDILDALDGYNWGGAVYDLIFFSLTRSSEVYNKQTNDREIYLAGYVPVLQVNGNYEK